MSKYKLAKYKSEIKKETMKRLSENATKEKRQLPR